jgi:DNA-binding Lrp family transcriptional regulator
MRIDRTDLSLLRAIEWGGILAYNSAVRKLGLSHDEVRQRLDRLRAEGLLCSYQATIFVPPFLGQDWVWGCTLIQTHKPAEVAEAIRQKIPFVTEILLNSGFPPEIGPNLSILFYATDFAEIQKFLSEIRNIDYVEVYQIDRYSFPLPKSFSSDEMRLLRAIVAQPTADLERLATTVKQTPVWTQAKLERLVWDPDNPEGVVLVLPEIDWRKCENFVHVHFVLELAVSSESVVQELGKQGFTPVLESRLFRNKYLQLDADLWGFDELRAKKDILDGINGIHLAGLLLAEQNRVVTDWVGRLLREPE